MVPDDVTAVGRRPLLRRLGTGALLAGGIATGGGPVGTAGAQVDGTVSRTVSVNSPSGTVIEYELDFAVEVRQSAHVPPDVPHDEATIDPDDETQGATASGATAGGVDSYEYAVVLDAVEISNCASANVWIDDEPVDACDLAGGTEAVGVLSVNCPSGALVEYEFGADATVTKSSDAPPDVPHGEATRDPDDVVDGLHVSGATAGGVDTYEFAVSPSSFATTNCEQANVWIQDQSVDACAVSGGEPDGTGSGGGEGDGGDGVDEGDDADGGDADEDDEAGGEGDEESGGVAKLVAGDASAGDQFGTAVAVDGGEALVGAPFATGSGGTAGAAYAFAGDGADWSEIQRLGPGGDAGECAYGLACARDGASALVGAPAVTDADAEPGRAYLLDRDGSDWTGVAAATDTDEPLSPHFGSSLALDGETAVVGWHDPAIGDGLGYVFDVGASGWTPTDQLEPGAVDLQHGFGAAVALADGTALVGAPATGAPGEVHAFAAEGSSWTPQGAVSADGGSDGDDFGRALAVDGARAVVGAPGDGAAYVLEASGSSWRQTHRLTPDDGGAGFGSAVAVEGGTVLVGATDADDDGTATGAAFAFDVGGSSASQTAKLVPDDGAGGDGFGWDVALAGSSAVVGAPLHAAGGASEAGAAYVFEL